MASRGQSITISYVAWDTAANAGATGDSGNHTLKWIKDGTAATPTNAPAEVDGTNAPGIYKLVLTGAECTCDSGTLAGKSSTSDVVILPLSVTFEQLPTAAPGASSGLPQIGVSPLTNLDAAVSSRSSHAASDVWAVGTRALTTFGSLASDVWAVGTRTLTAFSFLSVGGIADGVWDEALSGHTTSGSAGEAMGDAGSGASASDIAEAVWDEALAGHATGGSAGAALGTAGSGASASDIAEAVWDEDLSGHATSGSAGDALSDAAVGGGGGPSAGDIADAVWDEALAGHTTTGSAGKVLGTNLDVAVSTRSSHAASDIWAVGTRTLTAFSFLTNAGIADAVWDEARSGHTTAGTFGAGIVIDGLSEDERDAIANALLDLSNGVEDGYTVRQSLQIIGASAAGLLSATDNGDGTFTVSIRNLGGSTLRITATTDPAGNRTDVGLTPAA